MRKSVLKVSLALMTVLVMVSAANSAPHDELKYMSKDTSFVIQFDLAKVQTTKLFKELIASHPMFNSAMAEAKKELGIEPLKVIKTVTMGFGSTGGPQDMTIVIDTPLDPSKAPLNKPNVKKKAHKGQTYYDLGKGGAATVLDGHTVIGSAARVLKTMDEVKQNGALTSTLAAASKSRDAKAQVWVFGKPPMNKNMGPMAGQIESLVGHVDFSAGIRFEMNVLGDPNFVKMMAATVGMQKQMAPNHPMVQSLGIAPLLQKVNVSDAGKKMSVGINLNEADVKLLKDAIGKVMASRAMMEGPGGGASPGKVVVPPAGKPPGMTPIPPMPKTPQFNRPPIQPAPAKK